MLSLRDIAYILFGVVVGFIISLMVMPKTIIVSDDQLFHYHPIILTVNETLLQDSGSIEESR